jgi:hypothetical protein
MNKTFIDEQVERSTPCVKKWEFQQKNENFFKCLNLKILSERKNSIDEPDRR